LGGERGVEEEVEVASFEVAGKVLPVRATGELFVQVMRRWD